MIVIGMGGCDRRHSNRPAAAARPRSIVDRRLKMPIGSEGKTSSQDRLLEVVQDAVLDVGLFCRCFPGAMTCSSALSTLGTVHALDRHRVLGM